MFELKQMKKQFEQDKKHFNQKIEHESKKEKESKKSKKTGINTSIESIREFCLEVSKHLRQNSKTLLLRLNSEIPTSAKQREKFRVITENSQRDMSIHRNPHAIQLFDQRVLENGDFEAIIKKYRFSKWEQYEIDNGIFNSFNRMIFDSFNQQLDSFRSVKNREVPNIDENWRVEVVTEKQLDRVLAECVKKTMEASESNCGFIPDKSTANQAYKVNVKYLVEIREERIVKMIQKEVRYSFIPRYPRQRATGCDTGTRRSSACYNSVTPSSRTSLMTPPTLSRPSPPASSDLYKTFPIPSAPLSHSPIIRELLSFTSLYKGE